ncbi:MAG: extracellular solute-binding protein [Treponema sp.]|nr:extracellular solute-binding protein [Treponema sp.]
MKKAFAVLVILAMTSALVFASGGGQSTAAAAGPTKITVELFDRGTDGGKSQADNNAWTQWVKDKLLKDLNIDVTFFLVGRWTENTDIINLMAAGSAPDLCYTYNTGMISSFRDQGGILDLSPNVDKLLPDMKKLLGSDPAFAGKDFIWRNLQPDGKMYSIPSYRVALAMRNTFIRKDWLDKLGLPIPTNKQQFHDALVAFRDKDPGNVGKNNVVPYGQDFDARWGLANMVESFVPANISDRDRYVYAIASRNIYMPGYKDGMRMMNQWYNEGLIFRDFPLLRVTDDFYNLIKSGVVGAFGGNWDLPFRTDYNIITDMAKNVPGANFVPVDCFENSSGVTVKDMYDKVGLQIFVPSFSKVQTAALQYLNWICIKDNYSFLQIGQEGVNHTTVNGVPQIIARPANDPWIQNSAQNIDMTPPINGIEMGSDDLNARVLALTYAGFAPDVIVNAYSLSTRNARAPVVVNAPTSKDGTYGQTLQDKADALIAQAITAAPAQFDTVWDNGIKDWLQSGGQEVMDERAQIANTFFK